MNPGAVRPGAVRPSANPAHPSAASRREPPFLGHVTADGFVIDVTLIGEDEARKRVFDRWGVGAALHEIDKSQWLLTLTQPSEVRCEAAPGLPLESAGNGLAPAGSRQTPPTGILRTLEGGRWKERSISDLPSLEPGRWIDLSSLVLHRLAPVERPAPRPVPIAPPAAPVVIDLRSAAKLGARSATIDELTGDAPGRQRWWQRPGSDGRAGAGSGGSGGSGAAGIARPPRPPRAGRGVLARLLIRSPASTMIGRRHTKYLNTLTAAFEGKNFDDALRDAIGLSGSGGFTSLRLPKRRDAVTGPTTSTGGGGGSIPWGATVHQHLSDLYRKASGELEKAGRFEEAAFVLADLLGNELGAVALLERHDRFALAADIADGRMMAADLVVRLRWRAGHRDRAIEVARTRGAYESAIWRLTPLDRSAARELRAEWVQDLSRSGDHLAAVEAAWPDPELRASIVTDIQSGMALGGPTAAHLFAYLLALDANSESRIGAIAMLRADDPALIPGRDRFLAALSDLTCSDRATDREVVSEALRVLGDAQTAPAWDEQTTRRAIKAFNGRADPLLRADLPSLGWHRHTKQTQRDILRIDAPESPGQLPVYDVAALAGSALLVAQGDHGARVLTLAGRTRAKWDIPTHRLLVADHGGVAFLANDVGDLTWELHRLNLTTLRVTPWLTIRVNHLEPFFDGGILTVVDEQGVINFFDTRSDPPRVLWRELNDVGSAVAIARSAGQLTAVVRTVPAIGQPEGQLEVWRWDLPSITLRRRTSVIAPRSQAAVTSSGTFLYLDQNDDTTSSIAAYDLNSNTDGTLPPPQHIDATGPVSLVTSGLVHALIHDNEDHVQVDLSTSSPGPTDIFVRFPVGTQPQIRAHGDATAVWDQAGQIVVVDTVRRQVISSLRSQL